MTYSANPTAIKIGQYSIAQAGGVAPALALHRWNAAEIVLAAWLQTRPADRVQIMQIASAIDRRPAAA